MPDDAAAAIALPKPRLRPPAPEPLERDPGYRLLFNPRMTRNPLTALPREAFERPYRRMRFLQFTFHGLNDPQAIQRVFLDHVGNYARPRFVRRVMHRMIGEGLLNAEAEGWRSQRRLMAPAFSPGAVAATSGLIADVGARSVARIAGQGEVVDMAQEATRTTLEAIDGALFSSRSGMTFAEVAGDVRRLLAGEGEVRVGQLLGTEALDWAPAQRRGRQARRRLKFRMGAMIRGRLAADDPPDDFITRLLRAFLAEHPPEAAVQLTLDNAMTFFVAGHETTANGLAWALYLLSHDPQAQAWAREEAIAAWRDGDPAAAAGRLPYLRMVWDETLRLYPPIFRIDREALADDELCGQPVRKGDIVTIWPWVLHRHRSLWTDPDVFNPENFDPEGRAGRPRYQYLPFGAGPRICIGMGFAQTEALILLSRWLCAFTFAPAPGAKVWPTADITLRPEGGVPLVVRRL